MGGGSTPDESLPTWLIALEIEGVNAFEYRLRHTAVPVIARIEKDRIILDLRTVARQGRRPGGSGPGCGFKLSVITWPDAQYFVRMVICRTLPEHIEVRERETVRLDNFRGVSSLKPPCRLR